MIFVCLVVNNDSVIEFNPEKIFKSFAVSVLKLKL
jgi:hypothetical protein